MINTVCSIGIGILGGFIGHKLRLPAGSLLGAILAATLFNNLRGAHLELPPGYDTLCQALVGVMIAASLTPQILRAILRLWAPMILSCLSLMMAGILVAVVFYRLRLLDFSSAYVSTSPGAMNVLVSISSDMQADAAMVGAFHLTRILIVSLSAPFIFKLFRHMTG